MTNSKSQRYHLWIGDSCLYESDDLDDVIKEKKESEFLEKKMRMKIMLYDTQFNAWKEFEQPNQQKK